MKEEQPEVTATEIRSALIEQGICTKTNAPTVSSINRHLRARGLARLRIEEEPKSVTPGVATKPKLEKQPRPRLNHSIENILGNSLGGLFFCYRKNLRKSLELSSQSIFVARNNPKTAVRRSMPICVQKERRSVAIPIPSRGCQQSTTSSPYRIRGARRPLISRRRAAIA